MTDRIKLHVTSYTEGAEPAEWADECYRSSPLGTMFETGAQSVTITKAHSITTYSRVVADRTTSLSHPSVIL